MLIGREIHLNFKAPVLCYPFLLCFVNSHLDIKELVLWGGYLERTANAEKNPLFLLGIGRENQSWIGNSLSLPCTTKNALWSSLANEWAKHKQTNGGPWHFKDRILNVFNGHSVHLLLLAKCFLQKVLNLVNNQSSMSSKIRFTNY